MLKFNLSALGAIAVIASSTPALAGGDSDGFIGPRAELMAGYENIRENALPTNEDGIAWAGAIGYDVPVAKDVIAGIDLEMGDSDNSRNLSPTTHWDTGRTLYAGGRIGFALSPTSMIYGKAGYANSELRLVNSGNTFFTGEVDGARFGAGLEQKLGRNTFVKGEYRYTDQALSLSSHQVMTGIGMRF